MTTKSAQAQRGYVEDIPSHAVASWLPRYDDGDGSDDWLREQGGCDER